jgi:hypothetical protein
MKGPGMSLTVRLGRFGERVETVELDLGEGLMRELTEPVELSDDAFSLLLASPGLYGGYGNAVEIRQRTFKMRDWVAREIAKQVTTKLVELFGTNDKMDGYSKEQLRTGRL